MKILLILSTIIVYTVSYGQHVSVKTEKKNYKIDETITLIFEVNSNVDSSGLIKGTNFKILKGPRKNQSVSTINGQTNISYSLTYEIQAEKPGKLEIISPTFYIDNKEYKANDILLSISGIKLTDKEIDEINFNEFKDNSIRPNGTLRFIITSEFGYIEEFKDFQWKFKRRLTKKEIAKLSKYI
jgi:hypothetical protein